MATPTTTLRVPVELRDEIARLAERRDTTMVDVLSDAVARLTRDEWWASVRDAFDRFDGDSVDAYRPNTAQLTGPQRVASIDPLGTSP